MASIIDGNTSTLLSTFQASNVPVALSSTTAGIQSHSSSTLSLLQSRCLPTAAEIKHFGGLGHQRYKTFTQKKARLRQLINELCQKTILNQEQLCAVETVVQHVIFGTNDDELANKLSANSRRRNAHRFYTPMVK